MNPSLLLSLGLSPEQSRIYLSLIESGPQSASTLAKSAKVQRTYIYNLTKDLEKKNLLRTKKEGKATFFVANSPDLLMSLAETKKQEASQTITLLESALPALKSQFAQIDDKPIIEYFEGLAGLKKLYLKTLEAGKTIYAMLQPSKVDPQLLDWLENVYLKYRIEKKIEAKVIVASGDWSQKYTGKDSQSLRETLVVPSEIFPVHMEMDIFGDNIAYMSYTAKQKLVGVLISQPTVARSMKAFYDLAWIGAQTKTK